jgi:hypothetical protein
VYKVSAERDVGNGEGNVVFTAFFSRVWRRCVNNIGQKDWEMVSHQQTPVLN